MAQSSDSQRGAIAKISVVGAGNMGHGLAQLFAMAGHAVNLTDQSEEVLRTSKNRIGDNLVRLATEEWIDESCVDEILGSVRIHARIQEAVSASDFIVESVTEDLEIKLNVLQKIEIHCRETAIISSNSSSFRVGDMAQVLNLPARFVGTHFWSPPYLMPLVEVVQSSHTSDWTVRKVQKLLRAVGKYPIHVKKDVAGFVGNRLQHALRREAIALVDAGVASPEDVDAAARLGFGIRMPFVGPLETVDLGGLALTMSIQEYLLPYLDRTIVPKQDLVRRVNSGNLGARTGSGFFAWSEESHRLAIERRDRGLIALLRSLKDLQLV